MSEPQPNDFLIGFAVEVVNPDLEIELMGLPQEVVDELHAMGRAVAEVLGHSRTRIRSSRVFKAVMDLMIASEQADAEAASRLVADNPELSADDVAGAAVPSITAIARGHDDVVRALAGACVGLHDDVGMGMTALPGRPC